MSALAMMERLMGVETEYAVCTTEGGAGASDPGWVGHMLLHLAGLQVPCLPGVGGHGLFLGNGARFYLDSGGHPELCTPEVDNPWEAVRYVRAGELLLRDLLRQVEERALGRGVALARCNVDYSGAGTTWACHENYGHRLATNALPAQLVPHLVSRILYTGAGGLNPFALGIEFCLSPRVYHLEQVISTSSTGGRGIYDAKDESLGAKGWHRLHVLCGESVCSDLALCLKLGATALVLALVEGGLKPGDGVELADPIEAMRTYNSDPLCRAVALSRNGQQLRALEIQRHYLELAQTHLDNPAMPPWAGRLCTLWQAVLDALEAGPPAVERRLDWAMKRALFAQRVGQAGFSVDDVRRLKPNDSRKLRSLRQQLCELDWKFGWIGAPSVFSALDQAGLLGHRLPESDVRSVAEAVHDPPARNRAHVRGELIRALAGRQPPPHCDWGAIWDRSGGLMLDLSDPFIAAPPAWSPGLSDLDAPTQLSVEQLVQEVRRHYERGDYDQGLELLDYANSLTDTGSLEARGLLQLYRFRIQCRRGMRPDALRALQLYAHERELDFSLIVEQVAGCRFAGLTPTEEIWDWIRQGEEILSQGSEVEGVDRACFRAHQACALAARGQWSEAKARLLEALASYDRSRPTLRTHARALADLADVHRLLGEDDAARDCLEVADCAQRHLAFRGDYADFTLLGRARLNHALGDVAPLLDEAERIQQRLGSRIALARTWLLRARLFPDTVAGRSARSRLIQWRRRIPGLEQCRRLSMILDHWEAWTSGGMVEFAHGDFFWGV